MVSIAALLLLTAAPPQSQAQTYRHWHDGKAELAGYDLLQPRYGQIRKGKVVLIYVSEPFSDEARVKADPGRHADSDVFEVLKLNLVKDFPTGIYDYNLMMSIFAPFEAKDGHRAGSPTKIAFSGQEWCGMLFEELLFYREKIAHKRFSYFDGEGDQQGELGRPAGGVLVDELFILVRQFPTALIGPGEKRKMPVLPSLERARLLHRNLAWTEGTLSRSAESQKLSTPAGSFEVETWSMAIANGERYTFWVERAFPHRLIKWTGPDGEQGTLRGVDRLSYWSLNGNGHEKYLKNLGF